MKQLECNNCGYEDEYEDDVDDPELFPNGLECPHCRKGTLKAP